MTQTIANSQLIDTWADEGAIETPSDPKKLLGWEPGEQPPAEFMNWLQNTFGSKINHLLKNGLPQWNPDTEWLAGAFVQRDGQGWRAANDNTNSEPSEANADWDRVATQTQLAALLALVNQAIARADALADNIGADMYFFAGF